MGSKACSCMPSSVGSAVNSVVSNAAGNSDPSSSNHCCWGGGNQNTRGASYALGTLARMVPTEFIEGSVVRSGWAMFTTLRGAVLRCSLLVAAVGRDYNGRREDDLYSLKSICGCIAFGSGGLGKCSFVFVFCIVFIKLPSMGSAFGLNSCNQPLSSRGCQG